jgi:hypothetical protein
LVSARQGDRPASRGEGLPTSSPACIWVCVDHIQWQMILLLAPLGPPSAAPVSLAREMSQAGHAALMELLRPASGGHELIFQEYGHDYYLLHLHIGYSRICWHARFPTVCRSPYYAPTVKNCRQHRTSIIGSLLREQANRARGHRRPQAVPQSPVEPAMTVADDSRDPLAGQATYAVRLAMSRRWVNRRVETFTFLDADTVRRRMSVDLTLSPDSTLRPGDTALVPLMLLAKHDLRNLNVRGGSGEALPVLNTEQNAEVAVSGIRSTLERFVTDLPLGHPDKNVDEEALRTIVNAEFGQEGIARKSVEAGGTLDRQLRLTEPEIRSPIQGLILELERAFMLLVPLEYKPNERIICKISYDAAIRPQQASGIARAYTGANRIFSSLGLAGRVEAFDNLAVGLGRSYHAEAVPPQDAYVAEAALSVRRQGAVIDDEPVTDDHNFRPHLRATPNSRGDEGKLSLIIHAHRQELLLPLGFSSLLISVVLAFLPEHVYKLDGQTFAALLLVPFALSAYYIRGQENSYVTHMLQGARVLAGFPLVAAISALTLGALGVIPPAKGTRLSPRTLVEIRLPFLVAVLPTIVLIAAVVAPTLGRVVRPQVRALQRRGRDAARRQGDSADRRTIVQRMRVLFGAGAIILIGVVLLAFGYGVWRGVSIWWHASVPTVPSSSLKTT